MIAPDLKPMFKKVFMLRFEEEPPYDVILDALQNEFDKEVTLANGDNGDDDSDSDNSNNYYHKFEWAKQQIIQRNCIEPKAKIGSNASNASSINDSGASKLKFGVKSIPLGLASQGHSINTDNKSNMDSIFTRKQQSYGGSQFSRD